MRLFVYFSEIQNRIILDSSGQAMGKLFDVSMKANGEVFPRAESFVVRNGQAYVEINVNDLTKVGKKFKYKDLKETAVYQKKRIRPDFSLAFDILDKQIVDTNDQKVVRVNDAHLLRIDHQYYLAHVDVGLRGLVRRLGWAQGIDFVVKLFRPQAVYLKHEELISWKYTHVLTTGPGHNVLQSDVARQKLSKIPAAELADIMEDLDVFEKLSLFKTFGVDLQRQVFTDMAPQEKMELIDQLPDKEAANLLENIPADEATDLLNDLSKEKRMVLLRHMHSKTSKKLHKLLGFAQDTAGGLMTTEYLSLKKDATVKDAMQLIKSNTDYPGNIFFVYIVDEQNRLIATTSLRRFINAPEQELLSNTAYPTNIHVQTDDDMEEVALLLEKYKFSSVPVLDESGVIQGVITSDDVMEELISLTWKKYKDQI